MRFLWQVMGVRGGCPEGAIRRVLRTLCAMTLDPRTSDAAGTALDSFEILPSGKARTPQGTEEAKPRGRRLVQRLRRNGPRTFEGGVGEAKDTSGVWTYDGAGRVIEERTPGLGGVIRTYDDADRVTSVIDSSGVRTRFGYDALGQVVADTNGLGYVAKHGYGPNVDTLFDRNNYKNIVTRDLLGRTTSLKDNENNTTLLFYTVQSDGSERDSTAYPDGTWEVTVTDRDGRTVQKLDKRGVMQTAVYGEDWGVDTVRYEMASEPILAIAYIRDAQGRTASVERIEGGIVTAKTEYAFDDANRMLSQTQTIGAEIKTTSYAYDDTRRSVTFTLPDGSTGARVLDERGRLDSVYLDGAMVAGYVYNGNVQSGAALGNGIESRYGRDAAGRLTSMAYGKPGEAELLRHDLGWDVAGQLKWAKKTPDAINDERYGLDKQGQLTEWKTGSLNVSNEILAPVDSLGWTLDSRGNWVGMTDSKVTIDARTHNGANEILTRNGQTFTYDDAGNLTSDGNKSYEWTLDGLLKKVTLNDGRSTEYSFDGLRRMVSRTEKDVNGTLISGASMLYNGWQLVQETRTTSTNTETRTYSYSRYIDDVVAMKVEGGSTPGTYYYHQGYNHDVEAITNASGQVVERYSINPYGEFSVSTDGADGEPGTADDGYYTQSIIGNKIVFQGRPYDAVAGLYDFRNRQYSPVMGRFVSRDPAGYGAGDLNVFRFEANRPHMSIDPYGLQASELSPHYIKPPKPSDTTTDPLSPGYLGASWAELSVIISCKGDSCKGYSMHPSLSTYNEIVVVLDGFWHKRIDGGYSYCKRSDSEKQETFEHEMKHIINARAEAKRLEGTVSKAKFKSKGDCFAAAQRAEMMIFADWYNWQGLEFNHANWNSPSPTNNWLSTISRGGCEE